MARVQALGVDVGVDRGGPDKGGGRRLVPGQPKGRRDTDVVGGVGHFTGLHSVTLGAGSTEIAHPGQEKDGRR